ncbi:hypothetical protein ACSZM8_06250 [Aeromonas caviae]
MKKLSSCSAAPCWVAALSMHSQAASSRKGRNRLINTPLIIGSVSGMTISATLPAGFITSTAIRAFHACLIAN